MIAFEQKKHVCGFLIKISFNCLKIKILRISFKNLHFYANARCIFLFQNIMTTDFMLILPINRFFRHDFLFMFEH